MPRIGLCSRPLGGVLHSSLLVVHAMYGVDSFRIDVLVPLDNVAQEKSYLT